MIRVALSCTPSPEWAILLPYAARFWHRLGVRPLFLLIGTESRWQNMRPINVALAEIRSMAVDVEFVSPVRILDDEPLSQVVRLYAAASTMLGDDDYLLMSDLDLMPLSAGHICSPAATNVTQLDIIDANSYEHFGRDWHSIAYHGARVRVWREIMGLCRLGPKSIREEMLTDLGERFDKCRDAKRNAAAMSHVDERRLGDAVESWRGRATRLRKFDRSSSFLLSQHDMTSGVTGRLDRRRRNYADGDETTIDAHLPPPDKSRPLAIMPSLRAVHDTIAQSRDLSWADGYDLAFRKRLPGSGQ